MDTLAVCINFIDEFRDEPYSEEKYSRLQLEVEKVNPINLISIRKSINQLVKWDLSTHFYCHITHKRKNMLKPEQTRKRETLLSKNYLLKFKF